MNKVLVNVKTLEMMDSLLVNLANEGRHYDKTRERVLDAINQPKKYAIECRGDVNFSEVRSELNHLGYKPINPECNISRIGFNTIGIVFGNWVSWSSDSWEDLGYSIIDGKTFLENPKKYIKKKIKFIN